MTDNWSASNYQKHASFVPKLGHIILDMLNPEPTEHILDFGCGDGVLTTQLANRSKSVIGIDASRHMITRANQQENKPTNTSYFTVDGYDLDSWFNQTQHSIYFDAVFSNATLHWLKRDPVKIIRNIRHVLKPQGRFVAEFGGFMNCGEIQTGLITALKKRGFSTESPWFFPSAEYYSKLLTENGFQVVQADLCPRMTELDTDIIGWIKVFGFNFFDGVSEQDQNEIAKEVQDHLQPSYQREVDGKWFVMYNRLRIIAIKK